MIDTIIAETAAIVAEGEADAIAAVLKARDGGRVHGRAIVVEAEAGDLSRSQVESLWLSLVDRAEKRSADASGKDAAYPFVAAYVRAREAELTVRTWLNSQTPGMVRQANGSVELSAEWIIANSAAPS